MPPERSQRKTNRHPKTAPRPIAPSPTTATPVPRAAPTQVPYYPLPGPLCHKLETLILLSQQAESLLSGFSYGLFTTDAEQRSAHARLMCLRNKYNGLRHQADCQLAALGCNTGSTYVNIPAPIVQKQLTPAHRPKLTAAIPIEKNRTQKRKYGPTSPHYTVDKALKRKADEQSSSHLSTQRPAKRKKKTSTDNDFVEESECERRREVVAKWPPDPLTNLGEIKLTRKEWKRMDGWSWKSAVGKGKGKGVEVAVESPNGTRWVGW